MSSSPSVEPGSMPDAVVPRELCVEQVMRCTDDESLALAVAAARTERELQAAIGVALPALADRLQPGTPLFAALTGEPLDPDWRAQCPSRPDSLFAELEFLRSVCPASSAGDLLAELVAARGWLER